MKFRNIRRWKELSSYKGLLFFAQRMEELTFEYSLDSYKAPTTNPPFLTRELVEELDYLAEESGNSSRYENILDELELRLQSNSIVNSLIKLKRSHYINCDRNNQAGMRALFSVLMDELEPRHYAVEAMEQIKEAVVKENVEKSEIDFLARELVTTLVNLGMSPRHIKEQTIKFFFAAGGNITADTLNEFFDRIYPHGHNFFICFKIESVADNLEDEQYKLFRIAIFDELPERFASCKSKFKSSGLDGQQKYAVVTVDRALDAYSAIKLAEAKIARLHGLFAIFHHKDFYELGDDVLVEQCCISGVSEFTREPNRMTYISDRRPVDAAEKLKEMLEIQNFPAGHDSDKFFRVVDFHAMSISSNVLENQLLNIWISLETITPPNTSKTKIENIVESIVPFISVNYKLVIFRQLLSDLNNWNSGLIGKMLSEVDPEVTEHRLLKLVKLVILEDQAEQRQNLYKSLKDFELMKYRIFRLNKILKTPAGVISFMEKHDQRVRWQIRRIYRTRNRIVHSGFTPEYTQLLVENAHTYFDQVFETCCELASTSKGFSNFGDVFNFVKWSRDDHYSWLQDSENFMAEDAGKILNAGH